MLIPEENVKDLQEIPDNVKSDIEIVPVKWIDKVLEVVGAAAHPLPEEEAKVRPSLKLLLHQRRRQATRR